MITLLKAINRGRKFISLPMEFNDGLETLLQNILQVQKDTVLTCENLSKGGMDSAFLYCHLDSLGFHCSFLLPLQEGDTVRKKPALPLNGQPKTNLRTVVCSSVVLMWLLEKPSHRALLRCPHSLWPDSTALPDQTLSWLRPTSPLVPQLSW